MKLILLIPLLIWTNVIKAQFVDQPPAGLLFVPVNDQVTLSCSVDEDYSVNWEVRIDGVALEPTRLIFRATFEQRGFNFTGVATTISTVSFDVFDVTGNKTNNGTVITCIAQQGISSLIRGNEVQVIFYDAPPSPTDLSVTEDELGSLNISWSLGFIEGVPVNYTLTVFNLNTTSAQPIIITGLLDQHYVFKTSRPCDVYSFTVTAVTATGNSSPSEELIFTKNRNSYMCFVTTPERTTITTIAASVSSSPGLDDGEIAGVVTGVFILIFFILIVVIIIIAIIGCVRKITASVPENSNTTETVTSSANRKKPGRPSQLLKEITMSQQYLCSTSDDESAEVCTTSAEVCTTSAEVCTTRAKSGGIRIRLGYQPQQLEEMAMLQLQPTDDDSLGPEKPFMQFDCEDPEGVTTYQNKVLLVEKKKKRITVIVDLKRKKFLKLGRVDLSEITVHSETGNMFVTTGSTGKVLKLSSTGKLVCSIGDFMFSNGLRINRDKLYVCDSGNHQIKVFDLNLNSLKTIPDNEKKCKPFQTPRDVDFDEHDNIYVAESRRIQVLSPDGNFIRMIGEGKIIDAISLKITENYIFATNFGEACISIFTTDGQHIQDFSKDHNLYDRPLSITTDKDYIYFSTFRGKLYIFERSIISNC